MKDIPHHLAKFLKKIAKEEKLEQKKIKQDHAPHPDSIEKRNRKLKKRIPLFRERSHKTSIK
ncbi:MAG: hypothetical protein WC371_03620 [Parachlamydiales bacterium]|jgi:hypothetical protein